MNIVIYYLKLNNKNLKSVQNVNIIVLYQTGSKNISYNS
jgi:hypothetical protein